MSPIKGKLIPLGEERVWYFTKAFMCPSDCSNRTHHHAPSQWVITLQIAPAHIFLGAVQLMPSCSVWFMSHPPDLSSALCWSLRFPSLKRKVENGGSHRVSKGEVLRSMYEVLLLVWLLSQPKDDSCSTKYPSLIYAEDFWPNIVQITDAPSPKEIKQNKPQKVVL